MMRVAVHIDRLVLQGFRHGDRHAIAGGLEQELALLLGGRRAVRRLAGIGDVPRVNAGQVSIGEGATAHRVGKRVARGIARGMNT